MAIPCKRDCGGENPVVRAVRQVRQWGFLSPASGALLVGRWLGAVTAELLRICG